MRALEFRVGGEDENGLHALAENHQEHKQEQADARALRSEIVEFAFDLALQFAAGAHHEDDHGDHKEGSHQHDPAFDDVFVQIQTGYDDSHSNRAEKGRAQSGIDGAA
jgi:hypothetical protein